MAMPTTCLLIYLPALPLMLRAVIWGVGGIFPALLVLSGMGERLLLIASFHRLARVYYRQPGRSSPYV